MAELTITIGGRDFEVVCGEGQEPYLKSAAAILDQEAQKLDQSQGRVTESRLLLMAGLMLADRTAAVEEELADLQRVGASTAPLAAPVAPEAQAEMRLSDEDRAAMDELAARAVETEKRLETVEAERDAAINLRDQAVAALARVTEKIEAAVQPPAA